MPPLSSTPSRNTLSSRRRSSTASLSLSLLGHWIFPSLCFLVGFFVGRGTPDFDSSYNDVVRGLQASSSLLEHSWCQTTSKSSTTSKDTADDGWNTIHVFYHNATLFQESGRIFKGDKKRKQQNASGLPHVWYSQANQDQVVMTLFHSQRNGYFIDLAANDATYLSNTYVLETQYEWTGLCMEPNPIYWYNLAHMRPNCQIVAAVVGGNQTQQVPFRYSGEEYGGIAGTGFDNGQKWVNKAKPAYTMPIVDLLERFQAPAVVDYLSLDVEGAETFVMENFPFDRYHIKVITAERLKGPIRGYLKANGYEFIGRLTKWGESLWIHKDDIPQLNVAAIQNILKSTLAEPLAEDDQDTKKDADETSVN